MAKHELIQVALKSGTTHRLCWVPAICKKGDVITLKNSEQPDREWVVLEVHYGTPPDPNWKVGGLG